MHEAIYQHVTSTLGLFYAMATHLGFSQARRMYVLTSPKQNIPPPNTNNPSLSTFAMPSPHHPCNTLAQTSLNSPVSTITPTPNPSPPN